MSGNVQIRGVKVKLHSFTEADLTPAYVGWLNDPEVVRFSNQRFQTHDLNSCRSYFASFDRSANLFVSIKRLDGQAIGTMSVYRSLAHGTADVGIMIGERSAWGGGFGQDAWDTLLRWLLNQPDLRKVTAGTLGCNKGMLKLMERSEMSLEGTRLAQELVDGKPQDILLYGKFA